MLQARNSNTLATDLKNFSSEFYWCIVLVSFTIQLFEIFHLWIIIIEYDQGIKIDISYLRCD